MSSFLVIHVRVFDGESVLLSRGCVLVEDGIISSISESVPSSLPVDCKVVSGDGCTLLPGLIDAHVHAFDNVQNLADSLHYGVTTVLDMHSEPEYVKKLREVVAENDEVADYRSCCHGATVKGGWPEPMVKMNDESEETARMISKWPDIGENESATLYVATQKAQGASYIKLMQATGETVKLFNQPLPTPTALVQKEIVNAAHQQGMLAVAHADDLNDTIVVLKSGVDGVMHGCVTPINKEMIDLFKQTNAFLVPTLVTLASTTAEEQEGRERYAQGLKQEGKEFMCSCLDFRKPEASVQNAYQQIRELKAAGVDIVAGTDAAPMVKGVKFGISLHHELSLYVNRCGLSPVEALRSATSVSANRFRLGDRGKIAPGLKADLLLVKGDPTTSIDSTLDIVDVWRNGVLLSSRVGNIGSCTSIFRTE